MCVLCISVSSWQVTERSVYLCSQSVVRLMEDEGKLLLETEALGELKDDLV